MFPCQMKMMNDMIRHDIKVYGIIELKISCHIMDLNSKININDYEVIKSSFIDIIRHNANEMMFKLCNECQWYRKYIEQYN